MAQLAQLKAKTEIKCPHETIFSFMKNNSSKLANALPQVFKSAQFIEGEEGRTGSVLSIRYELGGRIMSLEARTEINEEEKSIAYNVLKGEITQIYRSFVAKFAFNEKGFGEISFEYEKAEESCPNPDDYMNMALKVVNGLALHLIKNNN